MRKIRTNLSALVLALVVPVSAFAQTVDGVGNGAASDREVSAEDTAEDILALSDYERKFYQLALRSWAIGTPGFLIGAFFDEHTGHWQDGVHNFAYGIEFTTRVPEKYDLVVSLDWANLRTPDGYWLEDGDVIADADWGENELSLLTADVSFHWLTNLDKRDTWQLYYGIGLGASLVLGEFRKYSLDTAECLLETVEQRNSRDTSLLDGCYDDQGNPTILDDYDLQSVPPVLPSIAATLGLRYLIADRVSVALEGGFKGLYFYGGLELGYFWESRTR